MILSSRWNILFVVVFSLLVTLSGCGLGIRTRALLGQEVDMAVVVDQQANQNSPIAVDVAWVFDEERLKELLGTSAKEWFVKKDQLKRDYPDSPGFEVWEWEWIPGQKIPTQHLPLRANAIAGVVFARYHTSGEHRARIRANHDFALQLRKDGFAVGHE